jgi:hypothetical protein
MLSKIKSTSNFELLVAAEIRHFSEKKLPEQLIAQKHKKGTAILAFISTLLLLFL